MINHDSVKLKVMSYIFFLVDKTSPYSPKPEDYYFSVM